MLILLVFTCLPLMLVCYPDNSKEIGGLVLQAQLAFTQPRILKIIPASDPNGRFAASVDSHLLGLLWLLKLLGLSGLFEC